MVDVQLEIICLARGDLIPDAGRESRAEGSRQPEKCLDNRTMSSSSLWDDLVGGHKEKSRLSDAGLRHRQVPSFVHWHTHSGGSSRITL